MKIGETTMSDLAIMTLAIVMGVVLITAMILTYKYLTRDASNNSQERLLKFLPVRINILVIAFLIALVCVGILILICIAMPKASENQFVIGALIGLLSSGLTGLAGLGTTLISDK